MDKNTHALSLAFKRARGKKVKIRALEESFKCTVATLDDPKNEAKYDEILESLATAKALETNSTIPKVIGGQAWYLDSLISFAKKEAQGMLDAEYSSAFADVASEEEMLTALEDL